MCKASCRRIVGQERYFQLLKKVLLDEEDKLKALVVTGLPGVGKTTLVKSIYDDEHIRREFRLCAWVTVSENRNLEEILLMLIRSMRMDGRPLLRNANEENDDQTVQTLISHIHQELFSYKFLVVIDDIWDEEVFDVLNLVFPDDYKGSRIIVTSRSEEVNHFYYHPYKMHFQMHPLDKESSWTLLRENVFGSEICPHPLERIGRKIAANCGGIPLTIVVVAGQLSPEEKTAEHWKSVEQDIHAAVSKSGDSYMEIISQSYNKLPLHLKGCFPYMGAFPEDSEIHVSNLVNLWVAEGFLPPPSLEQDAKQCLWDLINRNLVLVLKFTSYGEPKTCTMQASLRKLAMTKCQTEKFFHVVDGCAQEGTESKRRLSVHENILMYNEGISQSTVSNNKLARTFIFAGPNHHHPLPFTLAFHLLRVLDALSVYFIELPYALFELIHLRYLSFTCDEDLPPEISKLRNLLVLIVSQHPKIIFRFASMLPVEIWKLPQMRHLAFQEMYLPDPLPQGILFGNLQSLSNVNAASCTKEILQNMPNLKKLKIWVEEPRQVDLNLDQLHFLESLKFRVLKPIPERGVEFKTRLFFPETLMKLSLSGCSLPWEYMTVILQCAPYLEVLKLRELAFRGEAWIVGEEEIYRYLKFLLLESLDLEIWDATYSNFPKLERLIIRHCYALEEIDPRLGYIVRLQVIELVDCSPQAVEWAEKVREERKEDGEFVVRIQSSWE